MSRPRKLNQAKQDNLLTFLAFGCPLAVAARQIDCSVYTIRREARRNPEFDARLRGSLLDAELSPISTLHEAAQADWRAAAWLLERTQPEQYGRRTANGFGRPEMTQLIERLSDVVRDEIRDRRQAARLRRRIRVEIQVVLGKLPPLSSVGKPEQPKLAERSMEEPTIEMHLASTASKTEAEYEQNEAKLAPERIASADASPWNSRPILSESA